MTLFRWASVQTADDNWFFYFDSHCTIFCIAVDWAVWHSFCITSILTIDFISFRVQLSSHNRSSDYYQQNSISTDDIDGRSKRFCLRCVLCYFICWDGWWWLVGDFCIENMLRTDNDIIIVIVFCVVLYRALSDNYISTTRKCVSMHENQNYCFVFLCLHLFLYFSPSSIL